MSRVLRRNREYRPSPLSRQWSNTNSSDCGIDGKAFDPQPNVCACSPQACNIPIGDLLDHTSIYIHYLAMMQSLGVSGPSELQLIISGGGGKPEVTAQLKTMMSRWEHLGWLKADTTPGHDGDTLGQQTLTSNGNVPSELVADVDPSLNDSPQHAEGRESSEANCDDESDGGPLCRQHTYRDMYFEGDIYGDYRGGPRGHGIYVEDLSDPEETDGHNSY